MRIARTLAFFVTAFVLSGSIHAANIASLSDQAVNGNTATAAEAIRQLRLLGPEGLNGLFAAYAFDIKDFKATGAETEKWRKIAAAIDTVAMQKDAYASQLFWYTDLEAAKAASKKADKPILTLRLLGNLNEEFSCANSRLFRSLLYSNAEISKYLRDNYILHWKSVRPAPRITIDFGDGRKIERTVTGNSIHYILDDQGSLIEALPGLYSPKAFMIYLKQAKLVNDAIDIRTDREKETALLRYRKLSFDRIKAKRDEAVSLANVALTEPKTGTIAILAAPRAMSKMMVTDETSILRVYDEFARFEPQIDFSDWHKLASLYSPTPALDADSTAFIRRQTAKTGLSEAEFAAMFAKLQKYVALDTTRNDFLYHMKLYEWMNERGEADLESFNSRVYDQIFQTPDSDKWLGLYSTDVYTALDGNGIVK
ncbi:MAG: hypothetical protein HOP17_02645 [Acidobacteria bacterium]|nr:hypothetical protein [Acidobacteriota bacterium]